MKQEKMTKFYSKEATPKKWFLVDATGQTLGRLASQVASIIRGKNKAIYTPNTDTGDFVIVINADKVVVTGKREQYKVYYHHSGYPGGLKSKTYKEMKSTRPENIIKSAVNGMLPKTVLGRHLTRKLKVFRGSEHPHSAQQPETISF